MATGTDQLYEADFYVWTQRQADALRRLAETRPNVDLDLPHLIEEVEDLGTAQCYAVHSRLRRIIEHCLKLEYGLATEPPRLWTQARRKADNGLPRFGEGDAADLLPTDCPYVEDLLTDGWYPANRRGVPDDR